IISVSSMLQLSNEELNFYRITVSTIFFSVKTVPSGRSPPQQKSIRRSLNKSLALGKTFTISAGVCSAVNVFIDMTSIYRSASMITILIRFVRDRDHLNGSFNTEGRTSLNYAGKTTKSEIEIFLYIMQLL